MTQKKVEIIHQEHNEDCFEILKSTIVEDKVLKRYRIDKDTLLHELPEKIVNEFLDFLGSDEQHRNLMLHMIKSGTLVINCWEDEENEYGLNAGSKNISRKPYENKRQEPFDPFDSPTDDSLPF
ncbi:hypothetical protein [Maribellus mangrovi]|uniref:hypothetical protein n=1 Tax=Maribellus mangrovi TaxID=3133146 RepID=UPI0030EF96FF